MSDKDKKQHKMKKKGMMETKRQCFCMWKMCGNTVLSHTVTAREGEQIKVDQAYAEVREIVLILSGRQWKQSWAVEQN